MDKDGRGCGTVPDTEVNRQVNPSKIKGFRTLERQKQAKKVSVIPFQYHFSD
mgnify:CR=1 FL=1